MSFVSRFSAATLSAGLMLTAQLADAAPVTFTFGDVTSPFTVVNPASGGNAAGNTYQFTSGGVTATVKAFGLTGSSNTTFQAGTVTRSAETGSPVTGQYLGLGVCNALEGTCSGSVSPVDSAGQLDYLLITFSQAINIASFDVFTRNGGSSDLEFTFFQGNLTGTLDGKTIAQLAAAGLNTREDRDLGTDSDSTPDLYTVTDDNEIFVTAILIGPETPRDGSDEFFKLFSLTGSTADVPAPGLIGLLGAGLVGLGMAARRRRAA